MGKKTKYSEATKDQFLKSLNKHLGNISAAALECNIDRTTIYSWIKNKEGFGDALEDVRGEQVVDHVENKLMELINGVTVQKIVKGEPVVYTLPPNVTAIIFFLKTRAKHRGYGEAKKEEPKPITQIKVIRE